MSTFLLDYRGARLSVTGGVLLTRCADGQHIRTPLTQLGRLIIACDADLSVSAIRQLAAARIPLHILRGRSRADASLLWPQSGDALRRLAQRRAFDHPPSALQLTRHLVQLRIVTQMRLLRHLAATHPRQRYPLHRASRILRRNLGNLAPGDSIDSLRGLEGASSAIHFAALARVLPRELGFRARKRRPPPDPVNACLSLGYVMLYQRILEEIHLAGLDATLGVLHRPCHNRASLACDLMEPERSRIEKLILRLFCEASLQADDFVPDAQGVLLNQQGRGTFFQALEPELRHSARRTRSRLRQLIRWLLQHHTAPGEALEAETP